eukprot:g11690.t1
MNCVEMAALLRNFAESIEPEPEASEPEPEPEPQAHVLLKNLAEKRAAKGVEVAFLVKALKDAETDHLPRKHGWQMSNKRLGARRADVAKTLDDLDGLSDEMEELEYSIAMTRGDGSCSSSPLSVSKSAAGSPMDVTPPQENAPTRPVPNEEKISVTMTNGASVGVSRRSLAAAGNMLKEETKNDLSLSLSLSLNTSMSMNLTNVNM